MKYLKYYIKGEDFKIMIFSNSESHISVAKQLREAHSHKQFSICSAGYFILKMKEKDVFIKNKLSGTENIVEVQVSINPVKSLNLSPECLDDYLIGKNLFGKFQ